jgi:O-antigen/teichoic acid export membrane protein
MNDASGPGGRRRAVARGSVINSVFLVGIGALNVLKALVAAAFLTQAEFGVWSIIFLGMALLVGLKAVAVSDKYIQQDEPDQQVAFQKSFTLELISAGILVAFAVALGPLLGVIYGERELAAPTMVLSLMLIGQALQSPIWVFYRRMDFLRQRLLLSVDPVVSFAITVGLAIAGYGYWSLVIGSVIGSAVGGVVALIASPYPLALRWDRATAGRYLSFAWPLMLAVCSALAIAHGSMFVGNLALGLAGAGAIGLAAIFAAYSDRVDSVITQAMYPAICRVTDRRETLVEAFQKSNRLALMWAVPFGVALSLFAHDIATGILGPEWEDAVILLQVFGLTAAISHIGFNWNAFYRAIGDTRPVAVVTAVALLTFLAAPVPLIFADGLTGFAIGTAVMTVVQLAVRWHYVRKLFPGFPVARHMMRAIAPTVPAALAILTLRLVETGDRTGWTVGVELLLYVAITVAATLAIERPLLREVLGYLRRARRVEPGLA